MDPRHPDRNAQFENIARLKKEYLQAGVPVISMDTKKKELLGNFYRDGKIDTQETIESATTTSPAREPVWCSRTVSTMSRRARASSTWAPATRPANSPVTAWHAGGTTEAGKTIRRRGNCWSCAMAGAATAHHVCVQGGTPGAGETAGHGDPRGPLPAVLLEVQSHRASPVPAFHPGLPGVVFHTLETVRCYMEKTETSTGLKVNVSILDKVYATGRQCARDSRRT